MCTNNAITVTVLKDPNLNNFENKTKPFDGTYTISPPTSLSLGTFTSSDPTVATIVGSTVTMGPGTTTITALQMLQQLILLEL
jgi:hypothetical protein